MTSKIGRNFKTQWTKKFIPNINTRLKKPLWLNYCLTQMLTGHGNFRGKLHALGLVDSPQCIWGDQNELAEDVLYHCPRLNEDRSKLVMAVHKAGFVWPCDPATLLETRELYQALDNFSTSVLQQNI